MPEILQNKMNHFRDNFWSYADDRNKVRTTVFDNNSAHDDIVDYYDDTYFIARLTTADIFLESEVIWYRKTFSVVLSESGGFVTSIIGPASIILAIYNRQAQSSALINNLYSQNANSMKRPSQADQA